MQKSAIVCGAGGFIGHHLVARLKGEGYWVRGADLKYPEFSASAADDFVLADLRQYAACDNVLRLPDGTFDEVYQLAADMGGMGFIHSAECEIMRNSNLINTNMIHAAANLGCRNYFFSSSVCVYPDMAPGDPVMAEADVYPAQPDNEYGWEKLYAERMALAYGRKFQMRVRIARFQNCYGPEGTYRGGREKAPAALCRKAAEAQSGWDIEVWGDGTAVRNFIYVDDLVDGIYRLVRSKIKTPVNIGTDEYVTVDELAAAVIDASGKNLNIRHVDGPVGVKSRNFSNDLIKSIGWKPETSLKDGILRTYKWVNSQINGTLVSAPQ